MKENFILEQYLKIIDESFIISETDLRGIITAANDNFCKISKFQFDELIGKPHNIVRHPDNPKKIFKELWDTIENGKIWEGKLKNRAKDGSSYYVKTVIAPIKDENGNNLYYISFRQDITELMKIKNKLALEKTLLTNIINNTNNMIFIRKNFKPFKANKIFLETLGIKSLKEFKEKYKAFHYLLEKKEDSFYTTDKDWDIKLSGQTLKVSIKNRDYLLYGKHFKLKKDIYSIITLTDITEIETARKRAEEVHKLKSLFLANVSHEIRTPLNSIMGYSTLMQDTNLTSKQKEYIMNIQTSADTLLNIVNTLLDFSKIESGKMTLEFIPANLYDIVISTFNTLKPLAHKKNLEFKLIINADKECIITDPVRLRQILINLLNNAIKFTQSGSVTLIVENDLTFRVIDSGVGIPKEKLPKIFEAYLQADDSITRKFGGTGLGLTISSKLAELMGGKLQVKSELNKGSEFYFQIKPKICNELKLNEKIKEVALINNKYEKELTEFLSRFKININKNASTVITTDEKTAKELNAILIDDNENYLYTTYYILYHNEQEEKNFSQFKGKILLADDYEFNRLFLTEILEKLGVEVDTAVDGEDAVKKALKNDYDLILMDVSMPNIDGIKASQMIKEKKSLPIIAVTAHAFEEDIKKFLQYTDDYLSKPVKVENLTKILNKYLPASTSIKNRISKKFNFSNEETKDILETFIVNTQESLTKLKKAVKNNDYQKLYEVFHNLKSSAGALEINEIYEISTELMTKALNKEKANYEEAITIIEQNLQELKKEV